MNNILYVTPIFPQQRVAKTISSLLANNKVTILTYDIDLKKKYILDNFFYDDLKMISLNLKGKSKLLPFKSILLHKKLKILLEEKFDLVIFRDIFTFDLAKRIADKSKCKLIMDVADNYPEVMMSRFKNQSLQNIVVSTFNRLEKKAIKHSSKIFTVTSSSKELLSFKHSINKNKISVLKNYPNFTNTTKHQKSKYTENSVKIVYVGTVDENVRDLGTVFKYIKNTKHKMDIYSSNKDVVNKLVSRFGVENNIRLLAPVKREMLPSVLSKYEIGVIPHKLIPGTEYTIPNKLYDYIHSGLLVLSTSNSALAQEINYLGVGEVYSSEDEFFKKLNLLFNCKSDYQKNLENAKNECKWEMQENMILEMLVN